MVRVLVVKPSSLGDVIHAAGPVARLAASCPGARVSWVVNAEYAGFVRGLPGVSEVVPFPRRRFAARRFPLWVPELLAWLRGLRGRFDVAVDLQGLQRSGLVVRASGAPERFGPADARELARLHYNRPLRVPPGVVHAVERLEHLVGAVLERSQRLREAGVAAGPTSPGARGPIPVPEAAREALRRFVPDDGPLLALCPGTRWASKAWPSASWAELLGLLAGRQPELRPVLLGGPQEEAEARAILERAREGGGPAAAAAERAVVLAGRTDLWVTAAVLERAACAVTLDSAPLHLAAAVGAPVVALFGPTDPARVAPRGGGTTVLRRDELDCLGCYRRRCPLPRRLCLPDLPPARVAEAVEALLAGRASAAEGGGP